MLGRILLQIFLILPMLTTSLIEIILPTVQRIQCCGWERTLKDEMSGLALIRAWISSQKSELPYLQVMAGK